MLGKECEFICKIIYFWKGLGEIFPKIYSFIYSWGLQENLLSNRFWGRSMEQVPPTTTITTTYRTIFWGLWRAKFRVWPPQIPHRQENWRPSRRESLGKIYTLSRAEQKKRLLGVRKNEYIFFRWKHVIELAKPSCIIQEFSWILYPVL